MSNIGKRRYCLKPCGGKELLHHHNCPLSKNASLAFVWLEKQLCGACVKFIFCFLLMQGIKGVADSCWINDKYWPKATSVSCCLGKQFAFDVIADNTVLP